MYKDVEAMHKKFSIDTPKIPRMLEGDELTFRIKALKEELDELINAKTIEDQIDALVDLTVFALGAAEKMGVHWELHWSEVMRANMAKQLVTTAKDSKRGYKLDLIKPPGWRAPDHTAIFATYTKEISIRQ